MLTFSWAIKTTVAKLFIDWSNDKTVVNSFTSYRRSSGYGRGYGHEVKKDPRPVNNKSYKETSIRNLVEVFFYRKLKKLQNLLIFVSVIGFCTRGLRLAGVFCNLIVWIIRWNIFICSFWCKIIIHISYHTNNCRHHSAKISLEYLR